MIANKIVSISYFDIFLFVILFYKFYFLFKNVNNISLWNLNLGKITLFAFNFLGFHWCYHFLTVKIPLNLRKIQIKIIWFHLVFLNLSLKVYKWKKEKRIHEKKNTFSRGKGQEVGRNFWKKFLLFCLRQIIIEQVLIDRWQYSYLVSWKAPFLSFKWKMRANYFLVCL